MLSDTDLYDIARYIATTMGDNLDVLPRDLRIAGTLRVESRNEASPLKLSCSPADNVWSSISNKAVSNKKKQMMLLSFLSTSAIVSSQY